MPKPPGPGRRSGFRCWWPAATCRSGTLLKKTDLKTVPVREADVPKGAIFADKEAISRVLLYPATVNEPLLVSKLSRATSGRRRLFHHRARLPGDVGADHRCQRRGGADPAEFARGRAVYPSGFDGGSHHLHHPAERQGALHRPHHAGGPAGGSEGAEDARGDTGARRPPTRRNWNWPRTRARSACLCATRWTAPRAPKRARSPRRCSTP